MQWPIILQILSLVVECSGLVIFIFKAGAFVNEVRRLRKDHDNHVLECKDRVETSNRTTSWLGDCIVTLGAKMNVDLPDRPE